MKLCGNCGESNLDASKFCKECGTALESIAASTAPHVILPARTEGSSTAPKSTPSLGRTMADVIAERAQALAGKRMADVMFVLDCTGSMQGEIDAIKDAITSFADTIESDGVRVRVGLVEFRDRLIGEEQRCLLFAGSPFTRDPHTFRAEVAQLVADGGGDEPESSLDAILLALRQPFDPEANRVLVLVTDAPPHIPDLEARSLEQVNEAIRSAGISQFYLVIRTMETSCQVYLKLLQGVRGLAFELGKGDDFRSRAEHFKKTLMDLGKTISNATSAMTR